MSNININVTIGLPEIEHQLTRIADALETIAEAFLPPPTDITKPNLTWLATSQEPEGTMLKMVGKVSFTPVNPDDGVTTRSLSVTVDGGTPTEQSYPAETNESDEMKLPVGASVHCELRDSDASGQESEPGILDFVVEDTIAPATPGVMGWAATDQVDE